MNSEQLEKYWTQNASNFPSEEGWIPVIKELLKVLSENGWDENIPFRAKEKYARFVGTLESDNEVLQQIVRQYEERLNQTCMICGDKAASIHIGWDYTFCLTHAIGAYPRIENIDEKGFSVLGDRYYWDEIKSLNAFTDYWGYEELDSLDNVIERIDFDLIEDYHRTPRENPYFALWRDTINWCLFLKKLPKNLLNNFLIDYINTFFSSLEVCKICGVVSLHKNKCLTCLNQSWEGISDKWKERWAEKNYFEIDYIKKKQLGYYSGGYNYELNKLEESFEKNKEHNRYFTELELIEYKNKFGKNNIC